MKASVHLGPDYEEHLRTKNTDVVQVKTLFDISQTLILNHRSEIYGISTIEWNTTPWMRSTLLHDRAIKLSKAKVHVYSDAVLCLGKMHDHPTAIQKWEEQIGWFINSMGRQELYGIDREPVELEWNTLPRHTILELLQEIKIKMATRGIKPEDLRDRIIVQ